ncbi:hypothetical protein O1611_g8206 [Lasiodiplodia mahajangana]|uniref:Uncharacterized protein n=1 Tax=Lasiodiplodia mahajangana TaxID=1108764 RepID=A0ACC2JD51_9PEZI|nr:hypothetical protein O1611_g8206 [Lasiodiplodia mahajangana]
MEPLPWWATTTAQKPGATNTHRGSNAQPLRYTSAQYPALLALRKNPTKTTLALITSATERTRHGSPKRSGHGS